MTDAQLMDADCIHGNAWWECPPCEQEMADYFAEGADDDA